MEDYEKLLKRLSGGTNVLRRNALAEIKRGMTNSLNLQKLLRENPSLRRELVSAVTEYMKSEMQRSKVAFDTRGRSSNSSTSRLDSHDGVAFQIIMLVIGKLDRDDGGGGKDLGSMVSLVCDHIIYLLSFLPTDRSQRTFDNSGNMLPVTTSTVSLNNPLIVYGDEYFNVLWMVIRTQVYWETIDKKQARELLHRLLRMTSSKTVSNRIVCESLKVSTAIITTAKCLEVIALSDFSDSATIVLKKLCAIIGHASCVYENGKSYEQGVVVAAVDGCLCVGMTYPLVFRDFLSLNPEVLHCFGNLLEQKWGVNYNEQHAIVQLLRLTFTLFRCHASISVPLCSVARAADGNPHGEIDGETAVLPNHPLHKVTKLIIEKIPVYISKFSRNTLKVVPKLAEHLEDLGDQFIYDSGLCVDQEKDFHDFILRSNKAMWHWYRKLSGIELLLDALLAAAERAPELLPRLEPLSMGESLRASCNHCAICKMLDCIGEHLSPPYKCAFDWSLVLCRLCERLPLLILSTAHTEKRAVSLYILLVQIASENILDSSNNVLHQPSSPYYLILREQYDFGTSQESLDACLRAKTVSSPSIRSDTDSELLHAVYKAVNALLLCHIHRFLQQPICSNKHSDDKIMYQEGNHINFYNEHSTVGTVMGASSASNLRWLSGSNRIEHCISNLVDSIIATQDRSAHVGNDIGLSKHYGVTALRTGVTLLGSQLMCKIPLVSSLRFVFVVVSTARGLHILSTPFRSDTSSFTTFTEHSPWTNDGVKLLKLLIPVTTSKNHFDEESLSQNSSALRALGNSTLCRVIHSMLLLLPSKPLSEVLPSLLSILTISAKMDNMTNKGFEVAAGQSDISCVLSAGPSLKSPKDYIRFVYTEASSTSKSIPTVLSSWQLEVWTALLNRHAVALGPFIETHASSHLMSPHGVRPSGYVTASSKATSRHHKFFVSIDMICGNASKTCILNKLVMCRISQYIRGSESAIQPIEINWLNRLLAGKCISDLVRVIYPLQSEGYAFSEGGHRDYRRNQNQSTPCRGIAIESWYNRSLNIGEDCMVFQNYGMSSGSIPVVDGRFIWFPGWTRFTELCKTVDETATDELLRGDEAYATDNSVDVVLEDNGGSSQLMDDMSISFKHQSGFRGPEEYVDFRDNDLMCEIRLSEISKLWELNHGIFGGDQKPIRVPPHWEHIDAEIPEIFAGASSSATQNSIFLENSSFLNGTSQCIPKEIRQHVLEELEVAVSDWIYTLLSGRLSFSEFGLPQVHTEHFPTWASDSSSVLLETKVLHCAFKMMSAVAIASQFLRWPEWRSGIIVNEAASSSRDDDVKNESVVLSASCCSVGCSVWFSLHLLMLYLNELVKSDSSCPTKLSRNVTSGYDDYRLKLMLRGFWHAFHQLVAAIDYYGIPYCPRSCKFLPALQCGDGKMDGKGSIKTYHSSSDVCCLYALHLVQQGVGESTQQQQSCSNYCLLDDSIIAGLLESLLKLAVDTQCVAGSAMALCVESPGSVGSPRGTAEISKTPQLIKVDSDDDFGFEDTSIGVEPCWPGKPAAATSTPHSKNSSQDRNQIVHVLNRRSHLPTTVLLRLLIRLHLQQKRILRRYADDCAQYSLETCAPHVVRYHKVTNFDTASSSRKSITGREIMQPVVFYCGSGSMGSNILNTRSSKNEPSPLKMLQQWLGNLGCHEDYRATVLTNLTGSGNFCVGGSRNLALTQLFIMELSTLGTSDITKWSLAHEPGYLPVCGLVSLSVFLASLLLEKIPMCHEDMIYTLLVLVNWLNILSGSYCPSNRSKNSNLDECTTPGCFSVHSNIAIDICNSLCNPGQYLLLEQNYYYRRPFVISDKDGEKRVSVIAGVLSLLLARSNYLPSGRSKAALLILVSRLAVLFDTVSKNSACNICFVNTAADCIHADCSVTRDFLNQTCQQLVYGTIFEPAGFSSEVTEYIMYRSYSTTKNALCFQYRLVVALQCLPSLLNIMPQQTVVEDVLKLITNIRVLINYTNASPPSKRLRSSQSVVASPPTSLHQIKVVSVDVVNMVVVTIAGICSNISHRKYILFFLFHLCSEVMSAERATACSRSLAYTTGVLVYLLELVCRGQHISALLNYEGWNTCNTGRHYLDNNIEFLIASWLVESAPSLEVNIDPSSSPIQMYIKSIESFPWRFFPYDMYTDFFRTHFHVIVRCSSILALCKMPFKQKAIVWFHNLTEYVASWLKAVNSTRLVGALAPSILAAIVFSLTLSRNNDNRHSSKILELFDSFMDCRGVFRVASSRMHVCVVEIFRIYAGRASLECLISGVETLAWPSLYDICYDFASAILGCEIRKSFETNTPRNQDVSSRKQIQRKTTNGSGRQSASTEPNDNFASRCRDYATVKSKLSVCLSADYTYVIFAVETFATITLSQGGYEDVHNLCIFLKSFTALSVEFCCMSLMAPSGVRDHNDVLPQMCKSLQLFLMLIKLMDFVVALTSSVFRSTSSPLSVGQLRHWRTVKEDVPTNILEVLTHCISLVLPKPDARPKANWMTYIFDYSLFDGKLNCQPCQKSSTIVAEAQLRDAAYLLAHMLFLKYGDVNMEAWPELVLRSTRSSGLRASNANQPRTPSMQDYSENFALVVDAATANEAGQMQSHCYVLKVLQLLVGAIARAKWDIQRSSDAVTASEYDIIGNIGDWLAPVLLIIPSLRPLAQLQLRTMVLEWLLVSQGKRVKWVSSKTSPNICWVESDLFRFMTLQSRCRFLNYFVRATLEKSYDRSIYAWNDLFPPFLLLALRWCLEVCPLSTLALYLNKTDLRISLLKLSSQLSSISMNATKMAWLRPWCDFSSVCFFELCNQSFESSKTYDPSSYSRLCVDEPTEAGVEDADLSSLVCGVRESLCQINILNSALSYISCILALWHAESFANQGGHQDKGILQVEDICHPPLLSSNIPFLQDHAELNSCLLIERYDSSEFNVPFNKLVSAAQKTPISEDLLSTTSLLVFLTLKHLSRGILGLRRSPPVNANIEVPHGTFQESCSLQSMSLSIFRALEGDDVVKSFLRTLCGISDMLRHSFYSNSQDALNLLSISDACKHAAAVASISIDNPSASPSEASGPKGNDAFGTGFNVDGDTEEPYGKRFRVGLEAYYGETNEKGRWPYMWSMGTGTHPAFASNAVNVSVKSQDTLVDHSNNMYKCLDDEPSVSNLKNRIQLPKSATVERWICWLVSNLLLQIDGDWVQEQKVVAKPNEKAFRQQKQECEAQRTNIFKTIAVYAYANEQLSLDILSVVVLAFALFSPTHSSRLARSLNKFVFGAYINWTAGITGALTPAARSVQLFISSIQFLRHRQTLAFMEAIPSFSKKKSESESGEGTGSPCSLSSESNLWHSSDTSDSRENVSRRFQSHHARECMEAFWQNIDLSMLAFCCHRLGHHWDCILFAEMAHVKHSSKEWSAELKSLQACKVTNLNNSDVTGKRLGNRSKEENCSYNRFTNGAYSTGATYFDVFCEPPMLKWLICDSIRNILFDVLGDQEASASGSAASEQSTAVCAPDGNNFSSDLTNWASSSVLLYEASSHADWMRILYLLECGKPSTSLVRGQKLLTSPLSNAVTVTQPETCAYRCLLGLGLPSVALQCVENEKRMFHATSSDSAWGTHALVEEDIDWWESRMECLIRLKCWTDVSSLDARQFLSHSPYTRTDVSTPDINVPPGHLLSNPFCFNSALYLALHGVRFSIDQLSLYGKCLPPPNSSKTSRRFSTDLYRSRLVGTLDSVEMCINYVNISLHNTLRQFAISSSHFLVPGHKNQKSYINASNSSSKNLMAVLVRLHMSDALRKLLMAIHKSFSRWVWKLNSACDREELLPSDDEHNVADLVPEETNVVAGYWRHMLCQFFPSIATTSETYNSIQPLLHLQLSALNCLTNLDAVRGAVRAVSTSKSEQTNKHHSDSMCIPQRLNTNELLNKEHFCVTSVMHLSTIARITGKYADIHSAIALLEEAKLMLDNELVVLREATVFPLTSKLSSPSPAATTYIATLIERLFIEWEICRCYWKMSNKRRALNIAISLSEKAKNFIDIRMAALESSKAVDTVVFTISLNEESSVKSFGVPLSEIPLGDRRRILGRLSHLYRDCGMWLFETNWTEDVDKTVIKQYLEPSLQYGSNAQMHSPYVCLADLYHQLLRGYAYGQNSVESFLSRDIKRKTAKELAEYEKSLRSGQVKQANVRQIEQHIAALTAQTRVDNEQELRHKARMISAAVDTSRLYAKYLTFQANKLSPKVSSRLLGLWFQYGVLDDYKTLNTALADIWKSPSGILSLKQLTPFIHQIASRIGTIADTSTDTEKAFHELLQFVLKNMALQYPFHCLYPLIAIKNGDRVSPDMRGCDRFFCEPSKVAGAGNILKWLRKSNVYMNCLISSIEALVNTYIDLALLSPPSSGKIDLSTLPSFAQLKDVSGLIPVPTLWPPNDAVFDPPPLFQKAGVSRDMDGTSVRKSLEKYIRSSGHWSIIEHVDTNVELTETGISRPRIATVLDCKGTQHKQIVKGKDDLRPDAVLQQLIYILNIVFREVPVMHHRGLYLRGYKVVPLSPITGIAQWVNNTTTIGSYLVGSGSKPQGAHHRYHPDELTHVECRRRLVKCREDRRSELLKEYLTICENCTPVMRFAAAVFRLEARLRYSKSLAVSSMVGYIVGIGDRHTNNILIDINTGELIHIDFGVAFEQGKLLGIPEKVPFRLTREMVDPLGCLQTDGCCFRTYCQNTLQTLRNISTMVEGVVEVLVHDPLYKWCLDPRKLLATQANKIHDKLVSSRQAPNEKENRKGNASKNTSNAAEVRDRVTAPLFADVLAMSEGNQSAKAALLKVRNKLQGLDTGIDVAGPSCYTQLSVQAHVERLVNQAQNETALSEMFAGWSPWL